MSMNPFEHQAPIPGITNIIIVGSGKGGVGKSTVAANIALALKAEGKRVGLLDADIYGPSVPRIFGAINQPPVTGPDSKIAPIVRHGLKLMSMGFLINENQAVVWRGPMLFKAIEQFFHDVTWGELDYLVIDLPPGTGDVALTIAQKVPVTGAIVVCTPQNLALVDAKKAIDMFKQIKVPIVGVIENMAHFTPPGTKDKIALFPKGDLNIYLDANGIKKIAEIPFDPQIGLAIEAGMPSVISASESDISKIFSKIAKEVISLE
ncbi:MAG: hypothetical protein A2Z20_07250 [Bdellovibrionales bacterium RBG_16_40_8]|nr:MAG: hypothetical protein A2Z20_07250 [Bdellovibrionales bacterium RBG_16_40_8]